MNLKSKMYSLHTMIYLPATEELTNITKHAVYSTLKFKSTAFDQRHNLGFFCILFYFTNSLPIDLIKVAIWCWNQGSYFLFHTKAKLCTFHIRLLFTTAAHTGWIFYLRAQEGRTTTHTVLSHTFSYSLLDGCCAFIRHSGTGRRTVTLVGLISH